MNTSNITCSELKLLPYAWAAYIVVDNRQQHLYSGQDLFEAVCRRKSAEIKYDFHENHGRVPA